MYCLSICQLEQEGNNRKFAKFYENQQNIFVVKAANMAKNS